MTFIPEYITRDGASPDTLYSQAGKINDNLEAIETELGSLVAGTSNFTFTCTALTGGAASALDGIDGDEASDGDTAAVFVGNNPGAVYFYRFDADNGGSENSPYLITPDINAGTKAWVLMSRPGRIWTGGAAPTVGDDSADGVLNGDVWLYSGDAWICASNAAGAAVWRHVLALGTGSAEAATGDHTHSGVYATTDHDHDSDYSAIGHTHDYSSDFADIDHNATHITGGGDEIDGDKLDIDWNPTNYTPTTVESYADSADNLTAHLKGIDTAIGSLGGGSDLSQLENTLAMMAWDLYAVDNTFDDVLTDDFGEGAADDSIDGSATSNAQRSQAFDVYTLQCASQAPRDGLVEFSCADVKGTIAYWQKVGTNYGFFSTDSAGSTPVSISPLYTNKDVSVGALVVYSGGSAIIQGITSGGTGATSAYVRLSQDVTDATAITAIYTSYNTANGVELLESASAGGAKTYTLDTAFNSKASIGLRTFVPVSSFPSGLYGGNWVRVKLKGGATEPFTVTNVGVGSYLSGSTTPSFGTGGCVEVKWGGASGVTAPQGSLTDWSDWTQITFGQCNSAASNGLLFSFAVTSNTSEDCTYTGSVSNAYYFTKGAAAAEWNTQATTGYTASSSGLVAVIGALEIGRPVCAGICVSMSSESIDCSNWDGITSASVTNAGSGTIYNAVSFDERDTWAVFVSGAWKDIVRDNSGTYQYKDSGGSWQNASVNSALGALQQAFNVTENQMNVAAVAAISDANWEASGGWSTSVTALDWAIGLLTTSGTAIPTFDNALVNFTGTSNLVTTAFEATAEPTSAYCVLKVKPIDAITENTDLKAWVSMDDGANYDQITLEDAPFREIGDYDYYRGDAATLTSRSDQTVRFKVSGHNGKRVEVYGIALGVKS